MSPPIESLPNQISPAIDWFRLQYAGDASLGVMSSLPWQAITGSAPPRAGTIIGAPGTYSFPARRPYASGYVPLIFRPLSP
jgi:hypothetical protein